MLKSFEEMRKIDVTKYVDKRDGIDYLNWAKCVDILHENGAETVYFEPVVNPQTGSSLYFTDRDFVDKNNNVNRCYETEVKVVVDDNVWNFRGPVTNGANPVKDNSMSQQRLWNCQTRLFVKCVAIHTGLGFGLWSDEEIKAAKSETDWSDLYMHSLAAVKERIEQTVTAKLDENLSVDDLAIKCGLRDGDEMRNMIRQLKYIDDFEKRLREV